MNTVHMATISDRFTGPIYWRLWVPAIIASAGWALSDIADAVVVGNQLGAVGLAAISLILPVYMLNCVIVHGLGLGGSVQFSKLIAQGKTQEAKENFKQIFLLALLLSMLTAILGTIFLLPVLRLLGTVPSNGPLFNATRDYLQIQLLATPLFYMSNLFNYYLRNNERQKRASIGSLSGNISDIVFNVLLVLGLRWGTRGAATATAIGQIIAILIYMPGFFQQESLLRFGWPAKKWIMSALNQLRAGMSSSIFYLYSMIFILLINNVMIQMGRESSIAIFDVLQNTSYLILYLYEGTALAMQPLLSTYHGEHNQLGKRSVLIYGFGSGILVGTLLILLIELNPLAICLLFGVVEPALQASTIHMLRIFGLAAFFGGINILLGNYYLACEQEKPAWVLNTLRGFVLLIPLTLLFFQFEADQFWWLFVVNHASSLLLFAILVKLRHYKITSIDETRIFQQTIMSTQHDLGSLGEKLEVFCEQWKANPRQQYFITMTIEELGLIILKHGFQGMQDGYLQITVVASEDATFEVHVRDNAKDFNPFAMQTSRVDDEDFDADGMGLHVIKNKAKEFNYHRYQGFNSVVVTI